MTMANAATAIYERDFFARRPGFRPVVAPTSASDWVEAVIAAGLDPWLVQNFKNASEWRIALNLHEDTSVPKEYFNEIFFILQDMGRVRPDPALKCWQSDALANDCSAPAIALRLSLARRCHYFPEGGYFGEWPALAGRADTDLPGDLIIAIVDISYRYGIPDEWLFSGRSEKLPCLRRS